MLPALAVTGQAQRAALRRREHRQPDLRQRLLRASTEYLLINHTGGRRQPTPDTIPFLDHKRVSLLNRCRSRASPVRRRRRPQIGRSFPRAGGPVALARPAY